MDKGPGFSTALQDMLKRQEQLAEISRLGRPDWLRQLQEFDHFRNITGTLPLASELTRVPDYLKAFEAAQTFKHPPGLAQMASEIASARSQHDRLLVQMGDRDLPAHMRAIDLKEDFFRSVGVSSYLDAMRETSVFRHAEHAAALAATIGLPRGLEQFRLAAEEMADKLAIGAAFHGADIAKWAQPSYMAQFSAAAAAAGAFSQLGAFDTATRESKRGLQLFAVPESLTLSGYKNLLDTAGLTLPRWPQLWVPRIRRVTEKERAARQQTRLSKFRQPLHVGRAKSLVHQYESYLQQVIYEAMASEYGNDWPDERLPLCGEKGKQLLSR